MILENGSTAGKFIQHPIVTGGGRHGRGDGVPTSKTSGLYYVLNTGMLPGGGGVGGGIKLHVVTEGWCRYLARALCAGVASCETLARLSRAGSRRVH